jgi:outer membrane protein
MKRTQMYVVCLFVLFLLIVPYRAFAMGLEVGVGYWRQNPSGTVAYEQSGLPPTNIDLKNDMNFDSKNKPFARVKAELPLILPNIYFMATPMEFTGTGTKTVNFGGHTYASGFDSKLRLNQYDLALYYSLPFLNTATLGILNVELGLDAKFIDFEATVADTTGTNSVSKKLTLPIPMVYAGIQVKPIKTFSVEAEGRGVSYGANHYYDIIGRLKVKPVGPLFVSGGYRYESIKIDQSDVKADIKFAGPFVEAGVQF